MTPFYNEEFVPDLGVIFNCDDDDDVSRTFLVTLDVFEKLSGKGKSVNSRSVSLAFLHHYRSVIFRMCLIAFKETPVWTSDQPFKLTTEYLGK